MAKGKEGAWNSAVYMVVYYVGSYNTNLSLISVYARVKVGPDLKKPPCYENTVYL